MARYKLTTHSDRVYYQATGKVIPFRVPEHERIRVLGRKKGRHPARKPKEKK